MDRDAELALRRSSVITSWSTRSRHTFNNHSFILSLATASQPGHPLPPYESLLTALHDSMPPRPARMPSSRSFQLVSARLSSPAPLSPLLLLSSRTILRALPCPFPFCRVQSTAATCCICERVWFVAAISGDALEEALSNLTPNLEERAPAPHLVHHQHPERHIILRLQPISFKMRQTT